MEISSSGLERWHTFSVVTPHESEAKVLVEGKRMRIEGSGFCFSVVTALSSVGGSVKQGELRNILEFSIEEALFGGCYMVGDQDVKTLFPNLGFEPNGIWEQEGSVFASFLTTSMDQGDKKSQEPFTEVEKKFSETSSINKLAKAAVYPNGIFTNILLDTDQLQEIRKCFLDYLCICSAVKKANKKKKGKRPIAKGSTMRVELARSAALNRKKSIRRSTLKSPATSGVCTLTGGMYSDKSSLGRLQRKILNSQAELLSLELAGMEKAVEEEKATMSRRDLEIGEITLEMAAESILRRQEAEAGTCRTVIRTCLSSALVQFLVPAFALILTIVTFLLSC